MTDDAIMRSYGALDDKQRETLGIIYRDLGQALAAAQRLADADAHPDGRPRKICAHVDHRGQIVAAIGRRWPNGEPQCRTHLAGSKRPTTGYPLEFVDPRKYADD